MKTIWRNFVTLIKRFKMATLLNLAGLTVAFTAFIIIFAQVSFEYNFDHIHSTSERVYRVSNGREDIWNVIHSRAYIEAIMHSSPHIEAATLINPYNRNIYFSTVKNGEKTGYKERVSTCSPGIVDVFDFQVTQGDKDCLKEPEKVIIPVSLAKKLFGSESAVGKVLHAEESIWTKTGNTFTIGAVYRDFPDNTQLNNVIYTAIDPDYDIGNWQAANFMCYLLLDRPPSRKNVEYNFNSTCDFAKMKWGKESEETMHLSLVPLTDIYFRSDVRDERLLKTGNRETSLILIIIALMVIIVAAINFTNFSTALAPLRIKNINTQKVLGGSDRILRTGFLFEAVILSFVSFIISLIFVLILQRTSLLSFVEADLRLSGNLFLVFLTGALSIVIGLVAGLYPAWYMTSFPPALVLKGNFGLSPKGKGLRTTLTGFQFVVSIGLIIAAIFIQLQRDYMQGYTVGFDRDQVAIVQLDRNLYLEHRESLVNRLKSFSGIEDVAFAREKIGSQDNYTSDSFKRDDVNVSYYRLDVSYNFLSVMGISVVEGREPTASDELKDRPLFIFNKMVRDNYDMQTGLQSLFGGDQQFEVLGFTDNIKLRSLRQADHNFAFTVSSKNLMPISYIRLKAGTNYMAAVDHIRKSIAEIDPGYPVEVEFYDTIYNALYQKEERLTKMVSSFGLLAIVISIAGVFGLVVFETQYRRKEIGVRRVFGADVQSIIVMFNKTYMQIVCAGFIIAAPLSYYITRKWLENFAYKIPLYWWVFAIAFIIVAAITLLTVTYKNWQAANANPVDSIKTE